MATNLPELVRKIDNAFVTTWYEIRPEAMDNILNATVIWAALYGAGCFKPQQGGTHINRTISYGEAPEPTHVSKGDTLPMGETELETMASWRWKYTAGHVQRSEIEDSENSGPSQIKSLVGMRLGAARDALEQKFEADITAPVDTTETGKAPGSINSIVPPKASRSTGTFGGIARPSAYTTQSNGVEVPSGTNAWWGPKYKDWTGDLEVNMLDDMKTMYNSIHMNQSPPNLLIGTQELFEIYEDFALDKSQLVKDETTRLADLGFEVFRFKGKPFIWSPNIDTNNLLMLNTDYIDIVYNPSLFFAMTPWKALPLQELRIAHILSAWQALTDQPRRHGRLQPAG